MWLEIPESLKRTQRGFTLIETLICLVIVSIISLFMMRSLVQTSARVQREAQDRMLQNTARLALSRVVKDIQALGLDTYVTNDVAVSQPKLVFANPYQIVFNGDLDQLMVVDPNLPVVQRGAIRVEGDDWTNEEIGADTTILYQPTLDYTDPNNPDYWSGAETVRIGLDVNGDGKIDPDDDTENDYWKPANFWQGLDFSVYASPNPIDYALLKEVTGFVGDPNDATVGANQRARDLLALGIRPWLANSYTYPTIDPSPAAQRIPPPLFQYWGNFCKNSLGATIECLLGDQPNPSGDYDGILSRDELADWINDGLAGGIYDETAGIDTNGDGRENNRIDEVLTKIVVTINLEAPTASMEPNIVRSDGPTRPYFYQDSTVFQTVVPVNIRLRGNNTSGI